MRNLGVTANLDKPMAARALAQVARRAEEAQLKLLVCDETIRYLPHAIAVDVERFGSSVDALLALGGDGTMLQAARLVGEAAVPLMGVNLGSLGFLTSLPLERLDEAMDALIAGNAIPSERTVACCTWWRSDRRLGCFRALNDVVMGWGRSSRIVSLGIMIDDTAVSSAVCDGIILSTPTGSTAHSLSAGGPIIHPESPVFLINLVCPHTLTNRPLVVRDEASVQITVESSSKDLLLAVDGQDRGVLEQGDRLHITRAEPGVVLLNTQDYRYFNVVRQKLHWRGSSL